MSFWLPYNFLLKRSRNVLEGQITKSKNALEYDFFCPLSPMPSESQRTPKEKAPGGGTYIHKCCMYLSFCFFRLKCIFRWSGNETCADDDEVMKFKLKPLKKKKASWWNGNKSFSELMPLYSPFFLLSQHFLLFKENCSQFTFIRYEDNST